jgi:hypothetical protein
MSAMKKLSASSGHVALAANSFDGRVTQTLRRHDWRWSTNALIALWFAACAPDGRAQTGQ